MTDDFPPLRAVRLDDDAGDALPPPPPPQEPEPSRKKRRDPKKKRRGGFRLPWVFSFLLSVILIGGAVAAIGGWVAWMHYSEGLPDY